MGKIDDLDYLFATARTHAMEKDLLNGERLQRMCEAKNLDDVAKILTECGWEDVNLDTPANVEQTLSNEQKRAFQTALGIAPDKDLVTIFMLRYDYHNLKTIIKGEAIDKPYEDLLMDCGRMPVATLLGMFRENRFVGLNPVMSRSIDEAREVLNRTGDPQYADITLDRGCLDEMSNYARFSGSDFLKGYVSLLIDSINLRIAVRLKRVGRPYDFLKQAFIKGGFVEQSRLLVELSPDLLTNIFTGTELKDAATVGGAVIRGESNLADLDIACENTIMEYLQTAKYIGLGEQPLIGFVAAKETEVSMVRIIISGKQVGMSGEKLMEKLRMTYV